jgi:hypothetical protein
VPNDEELRPMRWQTWISRGLIAVAVLLTLAAGGRAQETMAPTPDAAVIDALDARASRFLEGVSLGQAETAFGEFLADSPLAQQTDAVKKLVAATLTIEPRFGKFHGFERIDARQIGKDLVLMKYLYKCENYPVVWYFTFYRDFQRAETTSDNNWRAIGVRFDTDLELLGF